MAIQFARIEIVSRSSGGNACCKGAYNARMTVRDERNNITFSYSRKGDNVYHEVLLPEHANQAFKNVKTLMNEIERSEKRKDSQLLKDVVIALPDDKELSLEDRIEITKRIILKRGWVQEGLGVQVDIHKPHDGEKNWHAHLLITTRRFAKDGNGFDLKARDLNPEFKNSGTKTFIVPEETQIHNDTRDIINDYFKELGLENRVDEISKVPQEHIGPVRMRSILNEAVLRNEKRVIANIESLKAGEDVVDRIIKTNSVFSKNDLVRAVKCVPDLDRRIQLVNDAMSLKNLVELYDEDGKSSGFFTTAEVRREEERLLRISTRVNEQSNIAHENNRVFVQTKLNNELSSHQQEAFEYLMLSDKGLRILQGRAGTGKSRVLGHIAKIAHDNNLPILGLAPTHKAKLELESVGFKNSDTIKGFLFKLYNDKASLAKNSIIVIDEAGMVGNSDYSELLRVAHKQDCNVILAGDERQLSSMSRGGMFEVFAEKYGSIELSDIRRQSEEWGKEVAYNFSIGNVRKAIDILKENEKILSDVDKISSCERLLTEWNSSEVSVDKKLIIAIKNSDVDLLNEGARELLKAKGELHEKEYVFAKQERGIDKYVSFSTGDRIVFTASDKEIGTNNGDFGKLECVSEQKFRVVLDNGKELVFNPNEFSGFKHGYASTIYKAQGASIWLVYVLHDGFAGLKNSYVAMSRHIKDLRFYINTNATRNDAELIRQLSMDTERKSTLAFFTKDELEAQKQIEPTGIFGKVSAVIGRQYTKLIDKRVNDEYYNYKRPIVASSKVEEMLLLVNEHMEARIDEITEANITENAEQAVIGSDIKKATPKQRFYANVEYQRSKAAQSVSTREAYASDVERLREIAKDKCELIAEHLLGAPNKHLSDRQTLRFGENGSIAVQIKGSKAGTWYDFSSTKGGDMFSLVQEVESCNFKDSVASLTSFLGVDRSSHLKLVYDISSRDKYIDYNKQTHQEKAIELAKLRRVEKLIEQAQQIEHDSIAHRYLSDTRKIDTALSEDIQTTYIYDARTKEKLPAIIAFARDSHGEITGGQQILLDPHTAHKSTTSAVPKKSFGKISGSFVEIAPRKNEAQPTIIAEGLETALSIKAANIDAHIICSLGVSNIKNYAPKLGERIIIAADNDGVGANSERSIESAALEFSKTTFVRVIKPQELGDFNDILQQQGSQEGEKKISEIFAPVIKSFDAKTFKEFFVNIEDNGHLSKENKKTIELIAKYNIDDSKLVENFKESHQLGVTELNSLGKRITEAEYVVHDLHPKLSQEIKIFSGEVNKDEIIKNLSDLPRNKMHDYISDLRDDALKTHIESNIDTFKLEKGKEDSIDHVLSVITTEQSFFKNLEKNHHSAMIGYCTKDYVGFVATQISTDKPHLLVSLTELVNEMDKSSVISKNEIIDKLKSNVNIEVIYKDLDKIHENHYIQTNIEKLSQIKENAKTPQEAVLAIVAKQKFLQGLHDNIKYPDAQKELLPQIKDACEIENKVESLPKLVQEVLKTDAMSSEALMSALHEQNPQDAHTILDKTCESHRVNSTISEFNKTKLEAKTPTDIMNVIKSEQEFLRSFDKNTKYPELHEHLAPAIKMAQDSKEQGVLNGLDKCVQASIKGVMSESSILEELQNTKDIKTTYIKLDKTCESHRVKTSLSQFNKAKIDAKTSSAIIDVIAKEQEFLLALDKNTKYPELHEHLVPAIKGAQKNNEERVVEGLYRCIDEAAKGAMSEKSVFEELQNTKDIKTSYIELDKICETHRVNSSLSEFSKAKLEAKTPIDIMNVIKSEQEFLLSFDKNTKYPELHEHLLPAIKMAQDNNEQGTIEGIDRCVTHIVAKDIMPQADLTNLLKTSDNMDLLEKNLGIDCRNHHLKSLNQNMKIIRENNTLHIHNKEFTSVIDYLEHEIEHPEHEFSNTAKITKFVERLHEKELEMHHHMRM